MENKNYVTLPVADGTSMAAYIALPRNTGEKAPALILFQEAFGVNHHIRDVAERFAAEGYVVIAPELFHRTAPQGFDISYTDFSSVMPHMQAMTVEGMEADIQASYQWLLQNPDAETDNLFTVGFCLGGRMSFLANSILPLKAAVSYYGGGIPPLLNRAAQLHGRHLFYWGGLDKHIGQDQIDQTTKALDEAGKEYLNVKISYADHGFNCNERASYNAEAAKEAWALTLAILKNNRK
jgi:carboxymethylenebutenolidase